MPKRMIQDVLAGRTLITATPDMSVRAASRLMAEKRIGALLVLAGGSIAGIFTERDALNKVLAAGLDPETTSLSAVMVAEPMTIQVDRPLSHALHMMAEEGFRHVPVLDADGRAIGMVSARDALGQDMVELESDMRRMEAMEASIGY